VTFVDISTMPADFRTEFYTILLDNKIYTLVPLRFVLVSLFYYCVYWSGCCCSTVRKCLHL